MNHLKHVYWLHLSQAKLQVCSRLSRLGPALQRFKNMMIDANSRVTMVDFGLAVQVAPGQELHDSCGTVPFAAPEVGWIGEPEDGVREARKL